MDFFKKNKNTIILAALMALLIVAYFYRNELKALFIKPTYAPTNDGAAVNVKGDEFPLKLGSKGERVKKVQKAINSKIMPPDMFLKEDGSWGPKTEKAALKYLKVNSIDDKKYISLTGGL